MFSCLFLRCRDIYVNHAWLTKYALKQISVLYIPIKMYYKHSLSFMLLTSINNKNITLVFINFFLNLTDESLEIILMEVVFRFFEILIIIIRLSILVLWLAIINRIVFFFRREPGHSKVVQSENIRGSDFSIIFEERLFFSCCAKHIQFFTKFWI